MATTEGRRARRVGRRDDPKRILVDSVDAAVSKVNELCGTITTPRTEIPSEGWYAIGTDSEGNPLVLYENLPG